MELEVGSQIFYCASGKKTRIVFIMSIPIDFLAASHVDELVGRDGRQPTLAQTMLWYNVNILVLNTEIGSSQL